MTERSEIERLRTEVARLRERVEHHDAVDRIEKLMYRYIHACDVVKSAELIASMFTEDAKWEGQGNFAEFGVTEGRAGIYEMFLDNPSMLPFTAHYLANASIGVAQDLMTGWGQWQVLEAATLRDGRAQVWMGAWYENDFACLDGSWFIKHIRYRDTFVTPFEHGWLKTRYVSPLTFETRGQL
ncbi:MAG: nuclear transport factor 2 family protein [Acidimicrobiales bacterium]|nr:nuclear transport factor 2 family protein [Acidimicrobiales bacterium]